MTIKKQKANNLLMPFSGVLMGIAIIVLTMLILGSLGMFDNYWNNHSLASKQYEVSNFLRNLEALINWEINNPVESIEDYQSKLSELLNNYDYDVIIRSINYLDSNIITSLKYFTNGDITDIEVIREGIRQGYNAIYALDLMSHVEYTWKSSIVLYIVSVLSIALSITNFSMKKKANSSVVVSNYMWFINLACFLLISLMAIGAAVFMQIEADGSSYLFDAKSGYLFTLMAIGLLWLLLTMLTLWISYLVIYKQKSPLVNTMTTNNVQMTNVQAEPKLSPLEAKIKKLEMKMQAKENPSSEATEFGSGKKLLFIGSIVSISITGLAILMVSIISLPLMIIYIIPSLLMYPLLIATLTLSIMTLLRVKNDVNSKKLFLATAIVTLATAFIGFIFMFIFYSILFGFPLPLIVIGGILMLIGVLKK